jgi:hypothetical protein
MSVREYSEMSYFSARALQRLGRDASVKKLLGEIDRYAIRLARQPAKIDYFATSLPAMLLFADDPDARQQTAAQFLRAQVAAGLGRSRVARARLAQILRRDPSHAAAADLLAEL